MHQYQSHPFTCSIASCTSGVKCKIASKSSANSNSSSSIIFKTKLSAALHFLVRWLVGYVMTSEKWCFQGCQKLELWIVSAHTCEILRLLLFAVGNFILAARDPDLQGGKTEGTHRST